MGSVILCQAYCYQRVLLPIPNLRRDTAKEFEHQSPHRSAEDEANHCHEEHTNDKLERYAEVVPWMMANRGDLDFLLHPNTCGYTCTAQDHLLWSMWGG